MGGKAYAGGLFGISGGSAISIKDCSNTGTISASCNNVNTTIGVGGLIGCWKPTESSRLHTSQNSSTEISVMVGEVPHPNRRGSLIGFYYSREIADRGVYSCNTGVTTDDLYLFAAQSDGGEPSNELTPDTDGHN